MMTQHKHTLMEYNQKNKTKITSLLINVSYTILPPLYKVCFDNDVYINDICYYKTAEYIAIASY